MIVLWVPCVRFSGDLSDGLAIPMLILFSNSALAIFSRSERIAKNDYWLKHQVLSTFDARCVRNVYGYTIETCDLREFC